MDIQLRKKKTKDFLFVTDENKNGKVCFKFEFVTWVDDENSTFGGDNIPDKKQNPSKYFVTPEKFSEEWEKAKAQEYKETK